MTCVSFVAVIENNRADSVWECFLSWLELTSMPCCVCSQIQLCREIHKSWQNPESSSCHRIGYYYKLFIQRFLKLQSLFLCVCVVCMLTCIWPACLVHMEARRGCWIPWDYSYRWLGIKTGSSVRAASVLKRSSHLFCLVKLVHNIRWHFVAVLFTFFV